MNHIYNKFIQTHLNLNLEINNSFLKQTVFSDPLLEKQYKQHFYANSKVQILLSEMMLILGYIASLIYIFFAFYKLSFLILCLIFLSVSLVLMMITHSVKSKRIKWLINHVQIFIICFSLNLKANLISFVYNDSTNDNHGEILRVIIYDFVSTNIFIIVRHEGNIGTNIFYFLINLVTIINAHFKSNKNHFYFLEILTSFFMSIIFYCFRKAWDQKLRSLFAEKYKIEKFYIYTIDFINGLNAYHLIFKNRELIFSNEKFCKSFEDEIAKSNSFNGDIISNNENSINNPKNINRYKEDKFSVQANKEAGKIYDIYNPKFKLINKSKEEILKNFKPFHNKQCVSKNLHENFYNYPISSNRHYDSNRNMIEKEINEIKEDKAPFDLNSKCPLELKLNNSENNINFNFGRERVFTMDNLKKNFNIRENKKGINQHNYSENLICASEVNHQMINQEPFYLNKSYYNKFSNEFLSNLIKYNSITIENKSMNMSFVKKDNKLFQKNENLNEKEDKQREANENSESNSFNLIYYLENYFINTEKSNYDRETPKEHSLKNFTNVGIFYYDSQDSSNNNRNNNMYNKHSLFELERKFFDIYVRRIKIHNNNIIHDLLLYDVTELINSKLIIYEENFKKQRILAKIAHEFKTPINSIIGLINSLKENFLINKNQSFTTLNLIENLSKYIIFLISDIIHYVNPNEKELKVEFERISLHEILKFCFDILNSLLCCNKKKQENIRTEFIFDENINNYELVSDEIRLKQILLNFISNSVKFTNHGKITLKAELINNNENIIISVIDTGIGIKDDNIKKLFSDFMKLDENGSLKNNKFGDGLGLSICKYFAKKLNIQINFDSLLEKGTKCNLIMKTKKREDHLIGYSINITNCGNNLDKDLLIKENSTLSSNTLKLNEPRNTYSNKDKKSLFKLNEDINNAYKYLYSEANENIKNIMNKSNHEAKNHKVEGIPNFDIEDSSSISNNSCLISYDIYSYFNNNSHEKKTYSKDKLNGLIEKNIENNNESNLIQFIDSQTISTIICELDKIEINRQDLHNLKCSIFYDGENILQKSLNNNTNSISKITCNNYESDKYKILIVDDNHFINESLRKLLLNVIDEEHLDFDIIIGQDGFDILKSLLENEKKAHLYKIIFTDENMDFLNGSEAIKLLRIYEKKEKINHINIVSITCYEDLKFVNFILSSGADMVLSKPISKTSIKNIFKKFGLLK